MLHAPDMEGFYVSIADAEATKKTLSENSYLRVSSESHRSQVKKSMYLCTVVLMQMPKHTAPFL